MAFQNLLHKSTPACFVRDGGVGIDMGLATVQCIVVHRHGGHG